MMNWIVSRGRANRRASRPTSPWGASSRWPHRAWPLLALLAAAGCAVTACGGDGRNAASTAGTASTANAVAAPGVAAGANGPGAGQVVAAAVEPDSLTDCPMVLPWRSCSVVERLERAGLAVARSADDVRQAGVSIPGVAYRLGDAELDVFLYADSSAAAREAAGVDVKQTEPRTVRGILRPPTLIHSTNLLALFFNNNDRQLERVELALTAGLPAP